MAAWELLVGREYQGRSGKSCRERVGLELSKVGDVFRYERSMFLERKCKEISVRGSLEAGNRWLVHREHVMAARSQLLCDDRREHLV